MFTIAPRILFLQSRIARFDDPTAYKELYITFYPSLFHFVSSFIKSRETAEEIISDVLMKIWVKRSDIEHIKNLRVYCFVMAKNLSLNYLEKQKRISTVNIDDFEGNIQSEDIDPEQLMITDQMYLRINHAVNELPARCKMVFILVKENGFKYKEVAEIMHISIKTVENQLAIALKKISTSINFDLSRALPVTLGTSN